ncbi:MAG: DUF1802 family protein [Phycisphaeraceae bacterium]
MLDVALKEWKIVTDLLLEGELALLLRKGGIHERGGVAVFELEHPRFALFPAWLHQVPNRMKPPYRGRVERFREEPGEVTLRGFGEAARIWQVPSREAFDQLDDLHVWSKPQIDMRFNYKPERPLYLMAVRVYQLAQPKTIPNREKYAGCRSWVPLEPADVVDDAGATPVLEDAAFERIVARCDAAMGQG